MNIRQNPETGQIQIYLKAGEVPDVEERLLAWTDFASEQSVTIFRLVNSYRKIVGRLDNIEAQLDQKSQYQAEQRERQK